MEEAVYVLCKDGTPQVASTDVDKLFLGLTEITMGEILDIKRRLSKSFKHHETFVVGRIHCKDAVLSRYSITQLKCI